MLPPAFSPAVPLGQASAPADPTGAPNESAPASPSQRRPDDFVDELDIALAGSTQVTASAPPPPLEASGDSVTSSPDTQVNAAIYSQQASDEPAAATSAAQGGGSTAQAGTPASAATPKTQAKLGFSAAKTDSSAAPAALTATTPAPLPAAASNAGANPNVPPLPGAALPEARTLPPVPVAPAPTFPLLPKSPAVTVPIHIPTTARPTTASSALPSARLATPPSAGSAAPTNRPGGAAPVSNAADTSSTSTLIGTPSTDNASDSAAVFQPLLTRVESAAINGPAAGVSVAQVAVGNLGSAAPRRGETAGTQAVSTTGDSLPAGAYAATPPQGLATSDVSPAAPSVAEQISSAVQANLESTPDQGRIDFHLRLDPPELGTVRVQLTLSEQTLTARLVAQDRATRQLIQNQMDTLRQRLQETGLGLGHIDVSGGGGRGGQRQQPLLAFPDLSAGAGPAPPRLTLPVATPVATGRVDVMA